MGNSATILHWDAPGRTELNVIKIVQFLGGTVRSVKLEGEAARGPACLSNLPKKGGCLISSADTLTQLAEAGASKGELRRLLMSLAPNVLVYGFEAGARHQKLVRELSLGGLTGVEAASGSARKIHVAQDSRELCAQLCGASFERPRTEALCTFGAGGENGWSPVALLGQKPFFVRVPHERGQMLLLAGGDIPDLDAPVKRETSILEFFAGLAPILMFLRNAGGSAFWHNDTPTACFIVDDPLLKRRYGFLDFERLLELMESKRFCTSIAFIPWNFSRSEPHSAKLFAANPERYSLCVHGCDHTRGEFGGADTSALREKSQHALERMSLHRRLSGVGFDDVMVFPQGIFSTAAMKALKSCGYLAAVNSTAHPVDDGGDLRLRDLLDVAVTRFSNFPLFTRRYPKHVAELAFDLFMGKPALLVEHHGFFRDGYEALADTIEKLHALEPRLKWSSLGETCSSACVKRTAKDGEVHVRFLTDRFKLRNETGTPLKFVLSRRAAPEDGVKAVTCGGRRMDFSRTPESVTAQLPLSAGDSAEIRIEHGETHTPALSSRNNPVYQAKVYVRRSLSEFRDNYVDRSRLLSRTARALKQANLLK